MGFDLGSVFDPVGSISRGTFNGASFIDPLGGDPLGVSGGSNADAPLAGLTGARTASKVSSSQGSPSDKLAAVARGEYDRYTQKFVPLQNELISSATTDPRQTKAFTTPLALLGQQQANMAGIAQRNMSRYGMAVDPRVSAAMNRQNNLQGAASMAAANNNMAQAMYDQNMGTLGSLVSLGRGLSTQSVDGLSAAAANDSARMAQQRAAEQQAAQAQAAQQTTLLSTAATAAMFY